MGRKAKGDSIRRPIPAVQKAFSILELYCSTKKNYTISEVSRIFGIPISTSSSLLYSLSSCGYLTRDERGVFSITMKLLTEASKGLSQMEVHDVAEPELKRLTSDLGLTSALYIKDVNHVVCIDKVEGVSPIIIASHVGKRFHMHSTCTGKAILAYLPDDEVERIVGTTGLPRFTPKTITSIPALKKELARVRSQGYAVDDQEFGAGIQGFAAPIFDSKGNVVAAISASRATVEMGKTTRAIISAVKLASVVVSKNLGYSESLVTDSSIEHATERIGEIETPTDVNSILAPSQTSVD